MRSIPTLCALAISLWMACTFVAQAQVARAAGGEIRDKLWGVTELTLDLSQAVPWRVYTLAAPDRLVVEFGQVTWDGISAEAMDQSDRIAALRIGALSGGWSRLVAQLAEPMEIDHAFLAPQTGGEVQMQLKLTRTDRAAFDASAGVPPDARASMPQSTAVAPKRTTEGPLVVMLDPGHGGIDPGALNNGVSEAELMLIFARELRDVLLRSGDFEVHLTRNGDHFVSLEGRVAAARAVGADLFVSLHADALASGVAHGASVYTLSDEASDAASAALAERHDRDDLLSGVDLSRTGDQVATVLLDIARLDNAPRSDALAGALVGGINNALGATHKRPLRKAGFSVLKAADIPSVLIELGFLSSDQDLANLQDAAWRAGMAAGIRDGIQAWTVEDAALARLRRQ